MVDYDEVLSHFANPSMTKQQLNALFKEYAEYDKIATQKGHGTGIYQTYCHFNSKLMPALIDMRNNKPADWALCTEYQLSWWKVFAIGLMIQVFVAGINFLIK